MPKFKRLKKLPPNFTVGGFIQDTQKSQSKKIIRINEDFDRATKSVTRGIGKK